MNTVLVMQQEPRCTSFESAADQTPNALATAVDMSGGEMSGDQFVERVTSRGRGQVRPLAAP